METKRFIKKKKKKASVYTTITKTTVFTDCPKRVSVYNRGSS